MLTVSILLESLSHLSLYLPNSIPSLFNSSWIILAYLSLLSKRFDSISKVELGDKKEIE